jgi:hypothetical protein
MSNRAPVVPAGAPFGATQSYQGMALRIVRVLDPATITDVLATDTWCGVNVVTDEGGFDSNGLWVPSQDQTAAQFTGATATAASDIVTFTAHGLANGTGVVFTGATGMAGVTLNRMYFVVGTTANTFQISLTPGGSVVDITSDGTAVAFYKGGAPLLVRAVKVTAS